MPLLSRLPEVVAFQAMIVGLAALSAIAFGAILSRLERAFSRTLSHHYGWRSVLVTAWLGSAVHELAHLVACRLFNVRVVDFKLFRPDPRTGTMGYVFFVQDGDGPFHAVKRFLVGSAPLVAGIAILSAALFLLQPELFRSVTAWGCGQIMFKTERLSDPKFWAFVYLSLAVGLHMAPSNADMKNGWIGFAATTVIAVLLFTAIGLFTRSSGGGIGAAAFLGLMLLWACGLSFVGLMFARAITRIFP